MLEPSPDSSCFKKKCTLSYFVVFFTQPLLLPFSFLYVSFQDMRLLGTGQPLCTKSFWEIQLCQTGRKHRPMLVRSPPLTTKWTLKLLGHGLPSLYDFPFVTWSRQRTHCKVSFCAELKKTFTLPNYREHHFSSFKTYKPWSRRVGFGWGWMDRWGRSTL